MGAARKPTKPRRVVGYARVSSLEQSRGSSLEDQKRAITAYAKALGLKVDRFYVEAESAVHEKIERREQIRLLMADVREGDLVVCSALDRWSRDPEYTYRSVREILQAGASFYAVSDQIDPSTSQGDSMLGIRAWAAREEHKRIRERMVGTRKLLRDRGYYSEGPAPFGYKRPLGKGEKGAEKNALVIDEKEAAKVREVYALCIGGHSLTSITKRTGITRDRLVSILRRRVYLGEIANTAGEWVKAKHPPILDADVFERAQAALRGRRLGGARTRAGAVSETTDWMLRDVARCGLCGARMSAAYAGPSDERRYYYRCSHNDVVWVRRWAKGRPRCTAKFVRVDAADAASEPLIVERLEELREELATEPKAQRKAVAAPVVEDKRAKLQRKRERYLEAFADGHMDREELRAAMAKLDAEVLRLTGAEAAANRQSPLADAKVRRAVLKEVGAIRKAWANATPETRRRIVGLLSSEVRLAFGAAPVFTWRTAEELAESA